MTGFGKGEWTDGKRTVSAELRSLNSKFLDLSVRIPSAVKDREMELRQLLGGRIQRGKSDLVLTISGDETGSGQFNSALAKKYFFELKSLSEELNTDHENLLAAVLQFPDVIEQTRSGADDDLWKGCVEAAEKAADGLDHFREEEGKVLAGEFEKMIASITSLLEKIIPYESERIETVKNRMRTNLEEIAGKQSVDQNRFEQELIYYMERYDFSEEKQRLTQHCTFFLQTMNSAELSGRKLQFISQEIGREINTLGSKANHAEIQKIVVMMKDEL